jgi:twitching motility protein PilT
MAHATKEKPRYNEEAAPTVDEFAARFVKKKEDLEVDKYFRALVKLQGSDLHMKVGKPPCVRVRNELKPLNRGPIDPEEMVRLLVPMMGDRYRRIFEDEGGADFAYFCDVDGESWRFRVNLLQQMGCMGLVARRVNNKIPDFAGLFLPPSIERLCNYDQGMVLLAGVTGSGKSTTIASMLNYINAREKVHILTLEDPIEFVFTDDQALINQREVGIDVKDFKIGMKHAVREDPDIMLVGEMRDEETFLTAIHAAETGHLVFGTLHTSSAAKTIDRIIDVFPAEEKEMIRAMLSESLQAVISQTLCKTKDGNGRVAAHEIMIGTSAIRNLIREAKIAQMYSAIQTGNNSGMQTLDQNLSDLVKRNIISPSEARGKAKIPENFPG